MLEISSKNARVWSRLGSAGTFGAAALDLAEDSDDFLVLTADLCYFSGLERLIGQYPEKCINVGIAEQNMIGVAAGLAKEGYIPFATTYATFASTRCLDQVRVNMGYMKLPIKLVGLTAGFSAGILGATHMSCEDIAIMRAIPNITILSPADCTETIKATNAAFYHDGPVYIRLSGAMNNSIVYKKDFDFEIGKAIRLKDGEEVALIATGSMVAEALQAATILAESGLITTVVDMHTLKPLDLEMLDALGKEGYSLICTVEEHSVIGGLGDAVAAYLLSRNKGNFLFHKFGVEDCFQKAGDYKFLLAQNGLTSSLIAQRISSILEKR